MKNEHNVYVLTSVIVLLCISWGLSYLQNKKQYTTTHIDIGNVSLVPHFDGLSEQQVYDLIGPSLYSGNVSLMAKVLSQFSSSQAYTLLEYIINQEEKVLSSQEYVLLVCAVAKRYESQKDRSHLFDIFLHNASLFSTIPLLYTVATSNYKVLLADIDTWIQKNNIDSYYYDAYAYAITQNDISAFQTLLGQHITKEQADSLLMEVITHNADAQFIPLLVQELGADSNYSPDGKKTVLMHAVIHDNAQQVRALLKAGANKDLFLDVQIGTALQIAIVQGKTDAELILREFGAQE